MKAVKYKKNTKDRISNEKNDYENRGNRIELKNPIPPPFPQGEKFEAPTFVSASFLGSGTQD